MKDPLRILSTATLFLQFLILSVTGQESPTFGGTEIERAKAQTARIEAKKALEAGKTNLEGAEAVLTEAAGTVAVKAEAAKTAATKIKEAERTLAEAKDDDAKSEAGKALAAAKADELTAKTKVEEAEEALADAKGAFVNARTAEEKDATALETAEALLATKTTTEKTGPAQRSPLALGSDRIYRESLAALTMLFVIAVLLENAFSIIFNWRVFLAYFSLRGAKTLIMFIVSLVIVWSFDIDVVSSLIATYKTPENGPAAPAAPWPVSMVITALILAGGSAGVYNIMAALGFRNSRRAEEIIQRPRTNQAWLAVRVNNNTGKAKIFVKIREIGSAVGVANAPLPIAGTLGAERPLLRELLFRSPNRFPENGGYTLSPNTIYEIAIEAQDKDGTTHSLLAPEKYVFAPAAIVDLDVNITTN